MLDFFTISPLFIWGTFTRLLGLLLAWAIGQLYFQAPLLAGKNGISPIGFKLKNIKRDFAPWKRFFYFPSLFWLNSSDRMMRLLILSGVASGMYIFLGGPNSWLAFLYCYLVYLSFDIPIKLSYPWDSLLFEMCILGMFLPDLPFLTHWSSMELPPPILIFLYQFLLFRLLFGFGKMKFTKFNWKDSGYFRGFIHTVPLPSKLAPLLYKAPDFLFLGMLWFSFIVEIILPFFMFVPGLASIFAASAIIAMMIGIQLLSNFGFFNILTILLAFTLFDHQTLIWRDWQFDTTVIFDWLLLGLLIFYGLMGLLNLPFNTWCSFTWVHWPSALNIQSPFFKNLVALQRKFSNWRLVHAFGVFPSKGVPCMKHIPIIEGSEDGINWKAYHCKYTLSHSKDKFHFIAPYHPRFDHALFYSNFGVSDANFNKSLVGACMPYDFAPRGGMDFLLQAILEGRDGINKHFQFAPFSEKKPPKWIRIGQYWFESKDRKEQKETGDNWNMYLAEIHKMPRQVEADFELKKTCFPELFPWDYHFWRMRTRVAKDWKRWAKVESFEEVLSKIDKKVPVGQDYFWHIFPEKLQIKNPDWKEIKRLVADWSEENDFQFQQNLNRYWNQLRIVLSLRCMPVFLEKHSKPLADKNFFVYGMLLNYAIMQGKETVAQIWKQPELLRQMEENFQLENGFYLEAIFRLETVIEHCRKLQWAMVAAPSENNPILPGFIRLLPFLHQAFPEECFNAWAKMVYNQKNGHWVISEQKNMTLENSNNQIQMNYFLPTTNSSTSFIKSDKN